MSEYILQMKGKNNCHCRWTGPGDKEGGDTGTDVRVFGSTLPVTRLFKAKSSLYYCDKESIREFCYFLHTNT